MGDAGLNDSHIRWDGSVLHLGATGNGIRMSCGGLQVNNYAGTETFLKAIDNGAVELYYDNVKRFHNCKWNTSTRKFWWYRADYSFC